MKFPKTLAATCLVLLPFASRKGAAMGFREVWTARYGSQVPVGAIGRRVETDGQGNVVVAAQVSNADGTSVLRLIKYDPSGELLWSRDLDGFALLSVGQILLAIDTSGFVHIAANHVPPNAQDPTAPDFVTALLDLDGQLQWAVSHGEPGSYDFVNALTIDSAGGTIIAGSDGGRGWITIRYGRDGTQSWAAREPGQTERFNSNAWGLSPGDDGDVFVTGQLDSDWVTLQYDRAGKLLWKSSVGQGSPGAIGRDSSGAVYVSGSLQLPDRLQYAVVKYDARGGQLWQSRLPEFSTDLAVILDMTVPPAGGVYVAAVHADTGLRFEDKSLVVAVDADGQIRWAKSETSASAIDLATDSSGNLIVLGWKAGSGTDITTSQFTEDGRLSWSRTYDGSGSGDAGIDDFAFDLALDRENNAIVVGFESLVSARQSGVAVKYGVDGQQRWSVRVSGVGGLPDFARALAVDPAGNTYVVGYTQSESQRDLVIAQVLSDGHAGWVSVLARPGAYYTPSAARLDREGNLFVCGSAVVPPHDNSVMFLAKLDGNGAIVWETAHGEVTRENSYGNDLVLDEAGNAYMTGVTESDRSGLDWATAKFDGGGKKLWAIAVNEGDGDEATALALGFDASLYVVGVTGDRDRELVFHTVKYGLDGSKLWAANHGEQQSLSRATALAPAPGGGVLVTGMVPRPSISAPEYVTIRYDNDGRELWAVHSGGPQINCCGTPTIAVDASGSALVTGSGGLTQKYSDQGALLWEALQPDFEGRVVLPTPSGGALVAGTFDTRESRTELSVVEYDKSGALIADAFHVSPRSSFPRLEGMAVDREGNLILAGSTGAMTAPSDFLILKLQREAALFSRGEVNQDGRFDISDGISIISALFRGGAQPLCEQSADIDADGKVSLSDAVFCFSFQLTAGKPPPLPFPNCGLGEVPASLGCASFNCR